MSVYVDWFGFVEGVANDARGMPTLVGYSPKFQICPTLPSTTVYYLVLGLIDDEEPEPTFSADRSITLDVRVVDPEGSPVIGAQQTTVFGEKKQPEVPGSIIVFVGAQLVFRQYGRYTAEAVVKISGMDIELHAKRDLFIVAK